MKYFKNIFKDENGSMTISFFPGFVIIGILLFAFTFNVMIMNAKKNEIQIMADSASRAGSLAVQYSYAVKERSGHGWNDYHVYSELDADHAKQLSNSIIQEFKNHSPGLLIDNVTENPSERFKVPVWNSRNFVYDDKVLSSKKQYKNGNFSVLIEGRVTSIWGGLLGIPNEIPIKIYSQSSARGKVTGYK